MTGGNASNFTSVIEAKSLKVGPGLQIFQKNVGMLASKIVLNKFVSLDMRIKYPTFQFTIYIFRALTDLRNSLESLKQKYLKLTHVCKSEK